MTEEKEEVREEKKEAAVDVKFEEWLTRGWKLYRSDMVQMIILALIFAGVNALLSKTFIGPIILAGPILCGIYYIIFDKMKGGRMNIGDIAKGFGVFLPALLASIVSGIFISVGFMLLIIPGFIVAALYMFTFPLIIDRGLDFWEAMETSRKAVMRRLVSFTLFFLLVSVVSAAGIILFGIGVILTLPFGLCTIAVAYEDIFGLEK